MLIGDTLLYSSTQILIIIHDLILDNVVDINLKCSGYKFCHLENSLAGFHYEFCFIFLVNALYPMWILFSVDMFFSFCNYTLAMVFYIIILQHFCCHCISSLLRIMFWYCRNSEHTREFYLFIKDMNDYHFERSTKMYLLIL